MKKSKDRSLVLKNLFGIDYTDLNWEDELKKDILELGVGGCYMGISPCLEQLNREDTQRLELHLLDGVDLQGLRVLEFGSGLGERMDTAFSRGAKSGVSIEVGFNMSVLLNAFSEIDLKVLPSLRFVSNESIDVAFSYDVLEHVVDPVAIVKTIREKLILGGLFAVVAPFEDVDLENYPLHLPQHEKVSLKDILVESGFEIIKSEVITDEYHSTIGYLCRK